MMSDSEGVEEAITTITYLAAVASRQKVDLVIYINPTYVAQASPLAREMRAHSYKPPRIQDVLLTILGACHLGIPIYTGLWSEGLADQANDFTSREDFDSALRNAIKKFNHSQDISVLRPFQELYAARMAS